MTGGISFLLMEMVFQPQGTCASTWKTMVLHRYLCRHSLQTAEVPAGVQFSLDVLYGGDGYKDKIPVLRTYSKFSFPEFQKNKLTIVYFYLEMD